MLSTLEMNQTLTNLLFLFFLALLHFYVWLSSIYSTCTFGFHIRVEFFSLLLSILNHLDAINTFLCVFRSVTPFLLRSQGRSEGHGLHFSSRISPSPNRSIHRQRERELSTFFLWRQRHRAHTEGQLPLSGVRFWKNQPWLVRVGGGGARCRSPPLHSSYHHVPSCSVWYAPVERAGTLPVFHLYPLYVLFGQKSEFWRNELKIFSLLSECPSFLKHNSFCLIWPSFWFIWIRTATN